MTGDFRLIDNIVKIFFRKPYRIALRTLGNRNELHGIIFMTFYSFLEKDWMRFQFIKWKSASIFYIMSSFVSQKNKVA